MAGSPLTQATALPRDRDIDPVTGEAVPELTDPAFGQYLAAPTGEEKSAGTRLAEAWETGTGAVGEFFRPVGESVEEHTGRVARGAEIVGTAMVEDPVIGGLMVSGVFDPTLISDWAAIEVYLSRGDYESARNTLIFAAGGLGAGAAGAKLMQLRKIAKAKGLGRQLETVLEGAPVPRSGPVWPKHDVSRYHASPPQLPTVLKRPERSLSELEAAFVKQYGRTPSPAELDKAAYAYRQARGEARMSHKAAVEDYPRLRAEANKRSDDYFKRMGRARKYQRGYSTLREKTGEQGRRALVAEMGKAVRDKPEASLSEEELERMRALPGVGE